MKHRYSVIVSNVGTVKTTDWIFEAQTSFFRYKDHSNDGGLPNLAGEDVILFDNLKNVVLIEHTGYLINIY